MVWKPSLRRGIVGGVAITVLVLLFGRWCLLRLSSAPVDLSLFLFALAALLSALFTMLMLYWLYGLLSLRYILDRNGLVIRWGPVREVIPMGNIQRVVPTESVHAARRFFGIAWPGYRVGRGYIKGMSPVRVYATLPLGRQLLVVTRSQVYGISPADPEAFLADLATRARLGIVRRLDQFTHRSGWTALPIWTDRRAKALILAWLLINLWLFGYICSIYPHLPRILPLHFDSIGEADRIGGREELFMLPLIGLIVGVFDTLAGAILHPRQRTGAYLLFATAVLVQALLWAAIVTIVT